MSGIIHKGVLRELTERSVDWLQSRADLQQVGLTIITRYRGNIVDLIDAEIARLGLYVFVWPVRPIKINPNLPGLYFEEFEWLAEIGENPTMNHSGCTAEYVAEVVALHMRNWDPQINGVQPLYVPNDGITDAEDPELNGYFVKLRAAAGIPAKP